MAKKQQGDGERGFLFVPPQQIRPMEGQPREFFDPVKMAELKGSIEEVGQLNPVKARRIERDRQGRIYELIDGERRWRICCELKRSVKLVIDEVKDEDDQYLVSTVSNFGHADHPIMEKARAILRVQQMPRFRDISPPAEQIRRIARAFARSEGWVYQHMRLLTLHEKVQERLDPALPKEEQLSFSVAVSLSGVVRERQLVLLGRIIEERLNMQQSRALINEHVRGSSHNKSGPGRKRKPSDELQILKNFLKRVDIQSAIILNTDAESVVKMLGGRTPEEKTEITEGLVKCLGSLQKMQALLDTALNPPKKGKKV